MPFDQQQVKNVKASEIDETSFTAEWDAIDDAQGYQATLNKHAYEGEKGTTTCDFTGSALASGWTSSSKMYATASGFYGNASPSLRLSTNGANLVMKNGEASISHIDFWMRAYQPANNATLKIQRNVEGEWIDAEEVALSEDNGKTYSFDIEPAMSVRLYFNRQATGNNKGDILLDDITVSGNAMVNKPVANYSPATTDKCTYTFTSLESGTEYGLTISAVNNGQLTIPSEELTLTTQKATDAVSGITNNATNGEQRSYDLTGRRVNGNNAPAGVYIIKGKETTFKVAK